MDEIEQASLQIVATQLEIENEISKHYEEVWRGSIKKALEEFQNRQPKGEFVLVIEGLSQEEIAEAKRRRWASFTIPEHLNYYMEQGYSKKDAIKKVAVDRNLPKREVYKYTIEDN